ncbi:MAG: DUF2809 domain-containing protein [Bacteroidales bacterium]
MYDKRTIIKAVIAFLVIAALGLFSKVYPAFEGTIISYKLSGLFYVTDLCLLIFLIFPGHLKMLYALMAFFITSIIEFLQLWNPEFLMNIRSTFLGHTILGSSFDWLDFPWYIAGAALGWLLLKWIDKE